MYLVEYMLGNYKIRKYILNDEMLARFIRENPQYEYVRVLEEVPEVGKVKVRKPNGRRSKN